METLKIDQSKLRSAIKVNELCVFITSTKKTSFAKELIKNAHPLMSDTYYTAKFHVNLEEEKKPILICEWLGAENSNLERRWLLNKAREKIKLSFNVSSLAIYLDEDCSSAELVMAEDFYFATSDALSTEAKLESFRILYHPSISLKQADPFREIRLKYHHAYRQWINENPDVMTPIEIGKRLKSFAKKFGCGFEELDVEKLKQKGLNLLAAVGQASERSPSRLFILTHGLNKKGKKPYLTIGKGITFDTGGINLKVFESFVNTMKNDMGGAALMSQLFMALVESGVDHPLVLVIPSCENLIAEKSVKPGAIIKSHSGKSVVIEHTDCEGRLILADAISYANEIYDAKHTFVAATLTTAVLRQFSNFFTGVHFAEKSFQKILETSGGFWGEGFSCWDSFLPFLHANKSSQADLTNMGRMPSHASIGSGSNVAAHFLKEFCKSDLTHFDIFASTWNWSADYPGTKYGATGAPFNSLFQAFREYIS